MLKSCWSLSRPRLLKCSWAIGVLAFLITAHGATQTSRFTISFDSDWRFLKADAPDAEKPLFDDTAWRKLDVPHDWSIEGSFDQTNRTGGAGAFLPAGVGWYRRHFELPSDQKDRRLFVEFDGIMANSEVFINGLSLGKRPYGYVSFRYELTGHVDFGPGKINVLAVRCDNSQQPASRWYAGAGIYRHVRLFSTSPIHLEAWSTFVTTPHITSEEAMVRVSASVTNQSDAERQVALQVILIGPNGKQLSKSRSNPQQLSSSSNASFQTELTIKKPTLWNLEKPVMYRADVRVLNGEIELDEETVPFGIRDFKFEPETGFWLNGRSLKIKGVCLHHDASALGAAVPLGAWERRLSALQEIGVNAIRTAHNPPAPEFLDLCDRMGFLVMDEMFDCWTVAKNPYDYHLYFNEWSKPDTRDTVRRDRNHPSIILYSAGNEIHDTPKADLAKGILRGLIDVFHENDPTRPVTQALFRPNVSHDYDNGLADMLDVVGQNYRENEILAARAANPQRKILGTENTHPASVWLALRDNPPYAGQFLWTGIDYLGESRRWPNIGFGSGLLDRTGLMRPSGYQRQSWWSDRPMVRTFRRESPTDVMPTDPGYGPTERFRQVLFSDWSPRRPDAHQEKVEVYSNCEQVELLLNGNTLGTQPLPTNASPRTWQVPFKEGRLSAIGRNHGRVVATYELRTAGRPARLALVASKDRLTPAWDDVCYVQANVVDKDGVPVTSANPTVHFTLEGPGQIAAVDSADNSSHESFQAHDRKAFQGVCFAILKANANSGKLKLTASADELKEASILIGCSK